MLKINNITEAREAIGEIGNFLERFQRSLGTLGAMAGNSSGQVEMGFSGKALSVPPPRPIHKPAPETMADRILSVLGSATKPLTPKEMVSAYLERGWPQPPNGKLYSALLASAYYRSE